MKIENHYQPAHIEKEAQHYWETHRSFEVKEQADQEKFYCLSMFPYPSGKLHMGHVRNYTIGDVISHYHRMQGKNVLQPIGWDAFGLPAENAAIKHKLPPAQWTYDNIASMRAQLKRLGFSYDWSREIATCKPEYYRWEQWLFTRLYRKDLVYRKNSVVNWDPVDQTVLANEQVVDGRGWRSGAVIERREIPQWFFKITAYAEELLNDLETLTAWPEQVRMMQRNWIGRSEGAEVLFEVDQLAQPLSIFTTRVDTLFGVTYVAVAADHPLASLAAERDGRIQQFITECKHIKVAEADIATAEKKGIDTGFKAKHPLTGELVPIWIANFVLMEYGSGAVMAVPAHDQRDFEFAQQYHLPIKQVIQPVQPQTQHDSTPTAFTELGTLINSAQFSGLDSQSAKQMITKTLIQQQKGQKKIHYRLRDWGVSRQRYWGTPIPIIYCQECGALPVPDQDLPVVLPEQVVFQGTGSPLKNMPEFYQTTCPQCGKAAQREIDTFDTFVESSWYYARYACPDQTQMMLDERARYWTPVDCYIGGIEHAVLHLLYARLFHKLLRDEAILNSNEPFSRLLTQGMVLKDGSKMSKSKGNIVDPQSLIDHYGADTIRLFMMFAAPPDLDLEWSDSGVEGANRFLKRLWAFVFQHQTSIQTYNQQFSKQHFDVEKLPPDLQSTYRNLQLIVKQALFDYQRFQFNTVVSAVMKLLNLLSDVQTSETDLLAAFYHQGISLLLRLLAPITPHFAHYLWRALEYGDNVLQAPWPVVDEKALRATNIKMVVQVNGKLRGHIEVKEDCDTKTIENLVLNHPQFQTYLQNKTCEKIIVIPGKLVNLVIK